MVVIKPTRDFTSEDRVSYAANNAAKPRQNTAINRYRQEISSGSLISRSGKAAKTNQHYKENHCNAMGLGIGHDCIQNARLAALQMNTQAQVK